jgi:hypothetical protein
VPLLVTAFTTPPPDRPNSALYPAFVTWTSWIASWLSVYRTALRSPPRIPPNCGSP